MALCAIGATAAVTWLGVVWALIGSAIGEYFKALAFSDQPLRRAGEAGFRFYRTVEAASRSSRSSSSQPGSSVG